MTNRNLLKSHLPDKRFKAEIFVRRFPSAVLHEGKMNKCFLPRTKHYTVLFMLFLLGCASAPPKLVNPDSAPPKIDISPEIELSSMAATGVSAVMDGNGNAHILMALSDPHELQYLVIGPQGIVRKDIVRKTGSFDTLDVAFDREGRLHAIVDAEHLVCERGKWRTIQENKCKKFVQGGKTLACIFSIAGKEVGSPGRWDIYGFGGPGFGIIWPWYTYPKKFVLIRETPTGWSDWTILDRNTQLDLETFKAVSDGQDTIHVVYQSGRGGAIAAGAADIRTGYSNIGYARLEKTPGETNAESVSAHDSSKREPDESSSETQGRAIDLPGYGGRFYDVAVDRESGALFIAYRSFNHRSYHSCLIRDGITTDCKPDFLSGLYFDVYLASAGNRGFHAVLQGESRNPWSWTAILPLLYLEYRNDKWSLPVDVGDFYNEWGAWGLVRLVSDRSGRAILIWPKEGKRLAARWFEPITQH